jgi:hypothetical protein
VGDLGPNKCTLAGTGRPPFWERPSRALPDPEELCRRGNASRPRPDCQIPPTGSAERRGIPELPNCYRVAEWCQPDAAMIASSWLWKVSNTCSSHASRNRFNAIDNGSFTYNKGRNSCAVRCLSRVTRMMRPLSGPPVFRPHGLR